MSTGTAIELPEQRRMKPGKLANLDTTANHSRS